MELHQEGEQIVLQRRWLTLGGASFVVVWQCAAVLMLAGVAQGFGGSPLRWAMCAMVAGGLYVAAAVALNRTQTRVGPGQLSVSHGPFPVPGWGPWSRSFSLAEMAQFTVRAHPARAHAQLKLRLKSGREVPLEVFPHPEVALCVEALFRTHLGANRAPSGAR